MKRRDRSTAEWSLWLVVFVVAVRSLFLACTLLPGCLH